MNNKVKTITTRDLLRNYKTIKNNLLDGIYDAYYIPANDKYKIKISLVQEPKTAEEM